MSEPTASQVARSDNSYIDLATALGLVPGVHWKMTKSGIEFSPLGGLRKIMRFIVDHPHVWAAILAAGAEDSETL